MKILNRFLRFFEQQVIGILMLVTVFLLFINVVMRYLFNSNLTWVEEFSRYSIVWISFVGASVCVYKGGHITVDTIISFLSEGQQRILTIVIHTISVLFSLFLGYFSLLLTLNAARTGQTGPAMGISLVYVYAAMPVGSLLLALRFGEQLYAAVIDRRRHRS